MGEPESGRAAKRALIIVSRRSPHWPKAWTLSEELVTIALGVMQKKQLIPLDVQSNNHSAITFLAKERWDLRMFIVFDLFHDTYTTLTRPIF
jgi:hypothetical protein